MIFYYLFQLNLCLFATDENVDTNGNLTSNMCLKCTAVSLGDALFCCGAEDHVPVTVHTPLHMTSVSQWDTCKRVGPQLSVMRRPIKVRGG